MIQIYPPLSETHEKIAKFIVHSSYTVHKTLGPGLLEKIYESCLEYELKLAGLNVKRQVIIPIRYNDLEFDEGLRVDLLVENLVILEIKAVETLNPIWEAQIISYLRLMDLRLGFLINFNSSIIKYGIKRYRN